MYGLTGGDRGADAGRHATPVRDEAVADPEYGFGDEGFGDGGALGGERVAQQPYGELRPLHPASGFEERPDRVADQALAGEARQGETGLHRVRGDVLEVDLLAQCARLDEGRLQPVEDAERVEAQHLPYLLGGPRHPHRVVSEGASQVGVKEESTQQRQRVGAALSRGWLAGCEARPYRRDLAQSDEHRDHRGVTGRVRTRQVVLDEVLDDVEQPGRRLGPFRVAARPVQAACAAWREPGKDRLLPPRPGGRRGQHQWRPERLRLDDPHVLRERAGTVRDDEGVVGAGDAGHSAGKDVVVPVEAVSYTHL